MRRCYTCKNIYSQHAGHYHHYKFMCIDCAVFNYSKYIETADMTGLSFYVSGARHKIGFECALKLLRCGATVYASSRFAGVALHNYQIQPDFDSFKQRLTVIECDYKNIRSVQSLIDYLLKVKLNGVINNACQTVQPTNTYLQKLASFEESIQLEYKRHKPESVLTIGNGNNNSLSADNNLELSTTHTASQQLVVYDSQQISKIDPSQSKLVPHYNVFYDINDDHSNSCWTKTIDEISDTEILEVNVINQIAPTLIMNRLMNHLSSPAFVINVTSVEGQFEGMVSDYHPHTNMCKAGLNMLTATLANNKRGVLVYSVDPGFVSGVRPNITEYPLNAKDGGSRVVDPIIQALKGNPYPNGLKLKDYMQAKI